MSTRPRTTLCLLLLWSTAVSAHAAYVTIDQETGLFRDGTDVFALPCVTYVQCQPGRPGMNAGPIQVLAFDLLRIHEDFAQMRAMGIRGIYMRVGAGMFLGPDGAWRRVGEPFAGVFQAEQAHADFLSRLDAAEAAGLGPFTYTREVFDYLLDEAGKAGIRVIPMILDTWSLPRKYEQSVQMTAIVHEEVWQATIQDWTRIIAYYRDRPEILGYLIEGETLHLPVWNDRGWAYLGEDGPVQTDIPSPIESRDPELTAGFQQYLRMRHGSVDSLRARWGAGYDRTHVSHDPNGVPRYPYTRGVFESVHAFSDIPLPNVERAEGDTGPGPGEHFPWWLNVPLDPVWVDFAYFKDWLYTSRLNELMTALRAADGNHLFLHSAAWDDVPVWHPFYTPWDHGALACDVHLLGGGYTDAVKSDDLRVPRHETVKELYQTVAPYRPWTFQRVGRAGAFGMGEGGFGLESNSSGAAKTIIPEAAEDRWISMLLMDNFGSGAAMANLWDWSGLVGATVERPVLHEHEVVDTIRALGMALEIDTFSEARDARVLILSNGITLHSLMKEAAINNLQALSNVLAMTHRSFDMATTDTVMIGPGGPGVDLNQYDAIFMPQQFPLTLDVASMDDALGDAPLLWPLLERWLDAKPERVLFVGPITLRDRYFNPITELPEEVGRVLGGVRPGPVEKLTGEVTWKSAASGSLPLSFDDTPVQALSLFEHEERSTVPFLLDGEAIRATLSTRGNGARVYHFSFPLGLSWMYSLIPEISGGRLNTRFDAEALAQLYGGMLEEAGIPAPYRAGSTLVVHVSDSGRAVLVRDRDPESAGEMVQVSGVRFGEHAYIGAKTTYTQRNGQTAGDLRCRLETNGARILPAFGEVALLEPGTVVIDAADMDGSIVDGECRVTISGGAPATLLIGGETVNHDAGGVTRLTVRGTGGQWRLAP